ncbi:phosphatidylglycerophosphatase A [bacterium]|jgi:phosphatidylglycerophosphatase A|nr:phosphatidylglycerophosphatase A [bacterium]
MNKNNIAGRASIIISTFFGAGYFPKIPGTVGTLIGFAIFFLLKDHIILNSGCFFVLLCAGFLVSGKAEKMLDRKDPGCIIIDEIAAVYIVFLLIDIPEKLFFTAIITGFIANRFFDIYKPLGINKLQHLNGSLGIMLDDILAAVYSNITVRVVLLLTLKLASYKIT